LNILAIAAFPFWTDFGLNIDLMLEIRRLGRLQDILMPESQTQRVEQP